jgi:hypothetical protein
MTLDGLLSGMNDCVETTIIPEREGHLPVLGTAAGI